MPRTLVDDSYFSCDVRSQARLLQSSIALKRSFSIGDWLIFEMDVAAPARSTSGARIIDSLGLRSLNLMLDEESLTAGFTDFATLALQC